MTLHDETTPPDAAALAHPVSGGAASSSRHERAVGNLASRVYPDGDDARADPWSIDLERIQFSPYFSRLSAVTQVVSPSMGGAPVHNRSRATRPASRRTGARSTARTGCAPDRSTTGRFGRRRRRGRRARRGCRRRGRGASRRRAHRTQGARAQRLRGAWSRRAASSGPLAASMAWVNANAAPGRRQCRRRPRSPVLHSTRPHCRTRRSPRRRNHRGHRFRLAHRALRPAGDHRDR